MRLFEQGAVFTGSAAEVVESPSLSLGLAGEMPADVVAQREGYRCIFELKGVVESLCFRCLRHLTDSACDERGAGRLTFFSPTRRRGSGLAAVRRHCWVGQPIAFFGETGCAGARGTQGCRQPVYLAEVDLEALVQDCRCGRATARELSRFQAVERDFSFTFADAVQWRTIAETGGWRALAIPELTRLAPVEIFRDAKASSVPAGHFALLLRCVFQSLERTLREDGADGVVVAADGGPDGAGRHDSHVSEPTSELGSRGCAKISAAPNPHYASRSMSSGVSVDEFQAAEQKVLRAVEIVKREREARAAAEAEIASLRQQLAAQAKGSESEIQAMQRRLRRLRARLLRSARSVTRCGSVWKRCCSRWMSCFGI